jgi:K+-transporting ATPase ATPase C chain
MNDTLTSDRPLDEHGGGLLTWLRFALIAIVLCGLAYPLATALLGRALFADAANGSLIVRDGRVLGSALVAQPFADARYLIPRPSAAGYDGMALAGSNWAPSNPALRERMRADATRIAAREGIALDAIPVELITASGSGIDPHLSPAAAALQLARIARARGLPEAELQALLQAQIEGPDFGVFGQPRVNVLRFNLALDALPSPPQPRPGGVANPSADGSPL